ncbi:hypothetical protein C4D60_Mb04t12830 [Musa balbisiana]|uniref:Uncharacterized protein n=1 Tax=Musa balbisiana TaxID=52838 RepID=A0A4S8KBM7_MUSBA|nr:hypothetical protein C4D60_Mb04t12830 [Musa balbisiana]
MFSRLFGKPNEKAYDLSTMDKLYETLAMLEKNEQALMKKVAAEIEKAKEFTKANNKRVYHVTLIKIIMLEGAKATTETIDALRIGAAAMKTIQKETNIDDVDKTMDEINEQTENMKQIQEALSLGVAADFDEDELEAELEELEGAELEEELLKPATAAPAPPVQDPSVKLPTQPMPHKNTSEEDELAALQSEMAM